MDDNLIHSVLVSIQAQIAELRDEMRERFASVDQRLERADRKLQAVEARLSSEISALRAQLIEHEIRHHSI